MILVSIVTILAIVALLATIAIHIAIINEVPCNKRNMRIALIPVYNIWYMCKYKNQDNN